MDILESLGCLILAGCWILDCRGTRSLSSSRLRETWQVHTIMYITTILPVMC